MGVGSTFLKILNGFLQVTFAIIALGLIIYGAFSTYLIYISNSDEVMRNYGTAIPGIVTTVFGILLFIVVFVGCCGLCRESTCCMDTYSSFLILLALCHLGLGTYTYVHFNKVETTINVQIGILNHLEERLYHLVSYRDEIENIQSWFSCCGATNYKKEYKYTDDKSLPNSCCENEGRCYQGAEDLNEEGCAKNVYEVTIANNVLLGWISLAVGASELIAALLGLCLSCCNWRRRHSTFR